MARQPPSATTLILRSFGLRRPRQMPAEELARAVNALALKDEDFEEIADDMGVTPTILRAWMTGTIPIPRERTDWIEVVIGGYPRQVAIRESGLPQCEWVKSADARVAVLADDEDFKKLTPLLKLIEEHWKTCPTCLARVRFLDERFGANHAEEAARPTRWWQRHYGYVSFGPLPQWVPRWAREGAHAVRVSLAALALIGALLAVPFAFVAGVREEILPTLPYLLPGAAILVIASGLAGLAMSFVGRKLDQFGVIGRGLAGTAGIVVFAGAWLFAARVIGHVNPFDDEPITIKGAIAFAFQIVLFGFALGSTATKDDERDVASEIAPAPSPPSAPPPTPTAQRSPPKQ